MDTRHNDPNTDPENYRNPMNAAPERSREAGDWEEEEDKRILSQENDLRGSRETGDWEEGADQPYLGADKDVSGRDIADEGREERAHHQQFGNRKYESYRNHSSADDQPTTNTGPGNF